MVPRVACTCGGRVPTRKNGTALTFARAFETCTGPSPKVDSSRRPSWSTALAVRLPTARSIQLDDAWRPRRGLRSAAASGFSARFCPKFWPTRYEANTLWPTRFAIARSRFDDPARSRAPWVDDVAIRPGRTTRTGQEQRRSDLREVTD